MKLCIPFKRNYKLNDEADEFDVTFDPTDDDFGKLIEFADEYENKRINVCYPGGLDTKTAKGLAKSCRNVVFRLSARDIQARDVLTSAGARWFLDCDQPAYSLTALDRMIHLGVSNVYLADDLWHDLKRVCDMCHDAGVNVRMVADRFQSTGPSRGSDMRDVFVRPDDVPMLEGVIDVIEFDCYESRSRHTKYDFARCDVMHHAYIERHQWDGNLQEINKDLKTPLANNTLSPMFTACKLSCRRSCAVGSPCRKCEQFADLAGELSSKNMRFRPNNS